MTVARAKEALDEGWSGSTGACQLFAAIGKVQVLKLLCRPRGFKWGCGVLASAAAAAGGHDIMLEWLIEAGCPTDNMALKALEIAVDSGRAEVVACCSSVDGDGLPTDVQLKADGIAADALKTALCKRDAQMVKALAPFTPMSDDNWIA